MNIRYVIVGVFLATALLTTGCADFKAYMKDRGNDFADCFTTRVGTAYGLGVRAQFTNYLSASIGASLGEEKIGYFGRAPVETKGYWLGWPAANVYNLIEQASDPKPKHGHCGSAFMWPVELAVALLLPMESREYAGHNMPRGIPFVSSNYEPEKPALPCGLAVFCVNSGEFRFSHPLYRIKPPTCFLREKFYIEVGATVGAVGFDLGFNPVEFVDFLLGWFGVDITDDDAKTGSLPESGPVELKESDEKNKDEQ